MEDLEGSPRSRSNSQPSSGILKEEGSSHAQTERKGILKGAVSTEDNSSPRDDTGDKTGESHVDLRISISKDDLQKEQQQQPKSINKEKSSTAPSSALEELHLHLADRRARLEEQEAAMASSSPTSSCLESQTSQIKPSSVPAPVAERLNGQTPAAVSETQTSSVPSATSVDKDVNEEEHGEDAAGLPGNSEEGEGESSAGELLDTDTPKRRLKRKSRFADRAARKER